MPGAERLRDSTALNDLIKQQQAADGLYAAICATPAVFFESKGILQGAQATAHPAFSDKLSNQSAVSQRVVVDGKLTTSRGPGTAFEFALALVKQLYGEGTLLQGYKCWQLGAALLRHAARVLLLQHTYALSAQLHLMPYAHWYWHAFDHSIACFAQFHIALCICRVCNWALTIQ